MTLTLPTTVVGTARAATSDGTLHSDSSVKDSSDRQRRSGPWTRTAAVRRSWMAMARRRGEVSTAMRVQCA